MATQKITIGADSLDTRVLCQTLTQEVKQLERRLTQLQQEDQPNSHKLNHFADLLHQRRTVLTWVQQQRVL